MADAFLKAVESRRSIYDISDQSPISDERVHEIVDFSVKHCPSTFNVQSARAVVLLGDQHRKLWDMAGDIVKKAVPEQVYRGFLAPRIKGFHGGHGSILFFEDENSLIALQQKNAMISHLIPEWSDHSSGLHQFTVWTALAAEGLGCNLQHYNFSPEFHKAVLDTWELPPTWKLKCQLVFGGPVGAPRERTYEPLEERVKVFK